MTKLTTAELYRIFLDSDWWRDLSRRKRQSVGHCERCPSKQRLQSHHIRYPDNWFDTRMEDLEVLCDVCHAAEHGITLDSEGNIMLRDEDIPEHAFNKPEWTLETLYEARGNRRISRGEFKRLRQELIGDAPIPCKVKTGKKVVRVSFRIKRHKRRQKRWTYIKTWRGTKWRQRGNSSN